MNTYPPVKRCEAEARNGNGSTVACDRPLTDLGRCGNESRHTEEG